jgi:hypothetical protein
VACLNISSVRGQSAYGSIVPSSKYGVVTERLLCPFTGFGGENIRHIMDGFLAPKLSASADSEEIGNEGSKDRQDDGKNIPEKLSYQLLADLVHGCCIILGIFLGG